MLPKTEPLASRINSWYTASKGARSHETAIHQRANREGLKRGRQATEIVQELGISKQTFESWKHKYGSMGVSDVKRLKQLEEENRQLKELVADLSLDNNRILGNVVSKNL